MALFGRKKKQEQAPPVSTHNPVPYELIPSDIRDYIGQILIDANMQVDERTRREMVVELHALLDNYLTSVIVENMPANRLEEFIRMNERGASRADVEAYMHKHIPNTGDVFAKALVDFRNMYVGNVEQARNST